MRRRSPHGLRSTALLAFALAATCPGCGPSIDEEELGTIYFKVPDVAGADQPYVLPQLEAEPDPPPAK